MTRPRAIDAGLTGRRALSGSTALRVSLVVAVVVSALAMAAAGWWWFGGGPAGQGYRRAACPPSPAVFELGTGRGLDRSVLQVGPLPVAPIRATVCRYAAGGAVVAGLALDPARTAWLAAQVAAPLDGYPDDALAAKRIPPLTDADLAIHAAPGCSGPAPTDVLTFGYRIGPAIVVRVRRGPCDDLSNGALTIRTPPRVTAALAVLAAQPGPGGATASPE